jgi:hypothetical protein
MNWLENLRRSFLDWHAMADVLPSMITIGLKNTLILAAASTVLGCDPAWCLQSWAFRHPAGSASRRASTPTSFAAFRRLSRS